MKVRGLFASVSLLALAACDLNALIPEDARTFEVPADSTITVPGTGVGINNPLAPEQVVPADLGDVLAQQLQQEFSTQDVQKDAVASMKLTQMKMTVLDPYGAGTTVVRHAGFLESLDFSLSAGDIEPVDVAFSAEGAFDGEPIEYEFELTGEELVDVLNAGEDLTLNADLETDVANPRPNFDTDLQFEVIMTVIADAQAAAESQT